MKPLFVYRDCRSKEVAKDFAKEFGGGTISRAYYCS